MPRFLIASVVPFLLVSFAASAEPRFSAGEIPVVVIVGEVNAMGTTGSAIAATAADSRILFTYKEIPTCQNGCPDTDTRWITSGTSVRRLEVQSGARWAGAEFRIGRVLLSRLETERGVPSKVAIVKFAAGSSSLMVQFLTGNGDLYNRFRTFLGNSMSAIAAQTAAEGLTPRLRGVFFAQGETDARTENYVVWYGNNLQTILRNLRADVNDPNLPVAVYRVNPRLAESAPSNTSFAFRLDRVAARQQTADSNLSTKTINGDDLELQANFLQYTRHGYNTLGTRVFDQIWALLPRQNHPPTRPPELAPPDVMPVLVFAGQYNAFGPSSENPDGSSNFAVDPVDSRIRFAYRMKFQCNTPECLDSEAGWSVGTGATRTLTRQLTVRGGPEIEVARQFLKRLDATRGHTRSKIAVIKYSVAESSFNADWFGPRGLAGRFRDFVDGQMDSIAVAAQANFQVPRISAVYISQGEADSRSSADSAAFGDNLADLVDSIRAIPEGRDAVAVIAKIHGSLPVPAANRAAIIDAQTAFVNADPDHNVLVSGDDLLVSSNPYLYRWPSITTLAGRAFLAIQAILE